MSGANLPNEKDETSKYRREDFSWKGIPGGVLRFLLSILFSIFDTLRSALFLLIKTPYVLMPSAAHTSTRDDSYNNALGESLAEEIRKLSLDPVKQGFIVNNWIDQIKWTNGRATRERDANELIRWWQVILGVLIPFIVSLDPPNKDVWVSVAGIFVATLAGVNQFRRPDERWRHYRLVTEQYLTELWSYMALCGPQYEASTHEESFQHFNQQMMLIRRGENVKFFGEVVPPISKQQSEDADK